jgi:YD repeat-containing protein
MTRTAPARFFLIASLACALAPVGASTAAQVAPPSTALATLCTALRAVGDSSLRDDLGCMPDQPILPAELRACRVAHVSVPSDSSHSRRMWRLHWSEAGRLTEIEMDAANIRRLEYDAAGRLVAIHDVDDRPHPVIGRDVTITYGASEIVTESRRRDGSGLIGRDRYLLADDRITAIEVLPDPRSAASTDDVLTTTMRHARGRLTGWTTSRARRPHMTGSLDWDRRGRPRRLRRHLETEWPDPPTVTFDWDARDRIVRVSYERGGDVDFDQVDYDCSELPGAVRVPGGVVFCRGARDCGPGEICVRDRDESRDATYCADVSSAANEGLVVVPRFRRLRSAHGRRPGALCRAIPLGATPVAARSARRRAGPRMRRAPRSSPRR